MLFTDDIVLIDESREESHCFGAMVAASAVQRENAGLSPVCSHFVQKGKG